MSSGNGAEASGSSTAETIRPVTHFYSSGSPSVLVVNDKSKTLGNSDPEVTIPTDDVAEAFKLTLTVLYEKIKHLGRLSVVFTQAKPDRWHEEQRLALREISEEEAHQWIICGLGTDKIVQAAAINGVCRHNIRSGEILTIPCVQTDSRTADSWYSKNGLQAYCGMRLTSLPECTLCVLWVVDPPESSVLSEAEVILRDLFNSIDVITSKLVQKLVDFAALSDARNKVAEQAKHRQYVTHELQNQLLPL